MIEKLIKRHNEIFTVNHDYIFFSPGRVNLIGEHIDYNGGLVFPMAINLGTYGIVSLRNDSLVMMFSEGFSKNPYQLNLETFKKGEPFWSNYVKGMITYLKEKFVINQGFNIYIYGNIPNGAGLSSSASLELLIGVVLREINDLNITNQELALLGKRVENEYIGLNSGIMDQFSAAMGKKDHAILLNTETLEYKYAPFNLGENTLIVGFTNKKRTLADSKYNERFNECREALAIIKKDKNINHLVEISIEELEKFKGQLTDVLFRRVKHVVTEQKRTIETFNALENNDILKLSKLLTEGHRSLQYDYEVTGIELDTLVDEFIQNGALGARQTGAGFGGCMIAIVPKNIVGKVTNEVKKAYKKVIGYEPLFYNVEISDGAKKYDFRKQTSKN